MHFHFCHQTCIVLFSVQPFSFPESFSGAVVQVCRSGRGREAQLWGEIFPPLSPHREPAPRLRDFSKVFESWRLDIKRFSTSSQNSVALSLLKTLLTHFLTNRGNCYCYCYCIWKYSWKCWHKVNRWIEWQMKYSRPVFHWRWFFLIWSCIQQHSLESHFSIHIIDVYLFIFLKMDVYDDETHPRRAQWYFQPWRTSRQNQAQRCAPLQTPAHFKSYFIRSLHST